MKNAFVLAALLFFPLLTVGQTDPIEKEVLNYSASKSDIISKGRRLLLDSFIADDLDKVEEVKNYLLDEVEDENYTVLYAAEHWLLLYWTEEFGELLNLLENFDQSYYEELAHKINPAQDMMFANLQGKSVVWKDKLEWKINNAALEEEEKDFLRLNLAWLLDSETEPDYLEKLNQRADEFLAAYPGTEYEDFVRQELRYKYVPTNWGF